MENLLGPDLKCRYQPNVSLAVYGRLTAPSVHTHKTQKAPFVFWQRLIMVRACKLVFTAMKTKGVAKFPIPAPERANL